LPHDEFAGIGVHGFSLFSWKVGKLKVGKDEGGKSVFTTNFSILKYYIKPTGNRIRTTRSTGGLLQPSKGLILD